VATTTEVCLSQCAIGTIVYHALVVDYRWEATMLAYKSEYEFYPARN
jgi:hypothetical protein